MQTIYHSVAQMNKDCDDFLVLLMSQKREADEQQKIVAANSEKIRAEEVECLALANVALADLQEAMPALEDAMKVTIYSYLERESMYLRNQKSDS